MNYNEMNRKVLKDFIKYKKKISVKIEGKRICMTEDNYLLFLKKIKESLCNWLDDTGFVYGKDQYMKLMNNLLKWIKN